MSLVGREKEISLLEKYINSENPEFIALYGRRRIGKTFLINTIFKGKLAFSLTGVIEGDFEEQIDAFVEALDVYGFSCGERPNNWMKAFSLLRKALTPKVESGETCIVFLDEIPCLDTHGSGFAKALGHFWNSWASLYDNFKLIVCGSATTWMIKNLIDSKGGLHNRITHEMKLQPFNLLECEKYLQSRNFLWPRNLILQAYMFTGGVAYYLSLFDNSESLVQNIDRVYFNETGELHREYKRLFKTLFNSADPYIKIIEILFKNKVGMNRKEIIASLGESKGGTLSEQLENLQECGFIRKYMVCEKGVIKQNGSIYQLVDLFSLFHLTFSNKTSGDENYWKNHLNTSIMNTWLGLSFEKVCLLHIQQIKQALKIDGISTQQYSWRSKNQGAQIDMVIDRADGMINLCEMKYSEKDYALNEDEYSKFNNRCQTFVQENKVRKGIFPTLITASALKKNQYSESIAIKLTSDVLFN